MTMKVISRIPSLKIETRGTQLNIRVKCRKTRSSDGGGQSFHAAQVDLSGTKGGEGIDPEEHAGAVSRGKRGLQGKAVNCPGGAFR